MSKLLNCDYNWDGFNTDQYHEQYTNGMILEDRYMTPATISGIYACMLANEIAPLSFERGIDVCNGGSPIAPALIAPLIRHQLKALEWTDIGKPQLADAQRHIAAGREQRLGGWGKHQQYMSNINSLWQDAMYRAADIGIAVKRSAFDLEQATYNIGSCNFGYESLTQDKEEWKTGIMTYFSSVKQGGIVTMQYMIGTDGYGSAGQYYPGIPIYPDDVVALAEQKLTHIQSYAFYKPKKQADRLEQKAVRSEGDNTSYKGMGVLIGVRK